MKFLIDECLSPHLVAIAHNRGLEAYHVVHRGWGGLSDPQLLRHLLDEELILVTNNSDDFLELVSGVELHPGLVVILENVRRAGQIAFEVALETLLKVTSAINKVVEIDASGVVRVFELPEIGYLRRPFDEPRGRPPLAPLVLAARTLAGDRDRPPRLAS